MENFIEPYHVQYVHKTTTSQPLEDHYVVVDEHCLGSAIDLTAEQQAGAAVGTLGVSSRYLTLFPNFVLGLYYPDQIGVHLNRPVSENSTHQSRVIYLHRDSDQSRPAVEQLRQLWDSVHREDHEMCERLQAGRHSTVAEDGGVLSPHWEVSVRRFQELVADAVRPGLESKI
jgi:choline monooxygenase